MLRVFDPPRARRVALVLGLLFALPTFGLGFFSDDWYMVAALRHTWPLAPPAWDLYDFAPHTDAGVKAAIGAGVLPWWTAPSLRLHLVRPLSSLLLALDERVFGNLAAGWHLHSVVWWVLLLLVVAALYRRLLPGRSGTIALFVFTLVPAHGMAYGWLSSRHMLVSGVPCLAALLAHLKAREDGWRAGTWLAPLGLIVGLLGGEAALGGVAFWLAYEAFGPPLLGSWRERWRAAIPALLIALAYFPAYRWVFGGGVLSSGGYVSPMDDPTTFLALTAMRFPMLLGHALLEVPVEAALGTTPWPFVMAGVVGVLVCAFLWRTSRARVTGEERAALRWLVPGALVAVVGTCGGLPGGRALLVANLGFSALLAVLIRAGWEQERRAPRVLAGLLAAIHLGLVVLMQLVGDVVAIGMARATEESADALPREVAPASRVFLLTASDPMVSLYAIGKILADGGDGLACITRLTSAVADHRVTRVDEHTLQIEPLGRPFLTGPFESLYRSPRVPMHAGDVVSACGAEVRVAAVEGTLPSAIVVRFPTPLDDPCLAFVTWDGGKLARVRIPAGGGVVLPWHAGPMHNQ